jgi:tetratricopeptide (TPR) repeat protein
MTKSEPNDARARDVDEAAARLAERAAVLGSDARETLWARDDLALAFLNAGRFDDAVAVAEAALTEWQRAIGANDLDSIRAARALADAYSGSGRADEAGALFDQVIAMLEKFDSPSRTARESARVELAIVYSQTERFERAETLERKWLAQVISRDGDQIEVIRARNNLGVTLRLAGKIDEALPLQCRALRDSEHLLGSQDPMTAVIRTSLASSLWSNGDAAAGLAMERAALSDLEVAYGSMHPYTLAARRNVEDWAASSDKGHGEMLSDQPARRLSVRENMILRSERRSADYGVKLMEAGRANDAEAFLTAALLRYPEDPTLHFTLAVVISARDPQGAATHPERPAPRQRLQRACDTNSSTDGADTSWGARTQRVAEISEYPPPSGMVDGARRRSAHAARAALSLPAPAIA